MKRSGGYPSRHRLLIAIASLSLACCHPRAHAAASTAPPSPSLSSIDSTPNPPSESTSTEEERLGHKDKAFAFFNKFETHGPTLTLTLRDPSTTALLGGGGASGGGGGDRAKSKLWPSNRSRADAYKKPPPSSMGGDDGTFGISSKIAALFHISPSASSTTDGQASSSSSSPTSQFADGYMLDDGEIFLDPPSPTSEEGSSSRGLFSIRDVGSGFLAGKGRSLAECAQNVHPELRYEMKTREVDHTANDGNSNVLDTRPFPATAPWISGISCGMIWSPFPIYKTGYSDGYGHKLMSIPHFLRCGARISLPRISRSTSRGIDNSFTLPKTKALDLGATYRESTDSPGGTLELLLGRSRASLPPSKLKANDNSLLQSDKYNSRNNHILLRLATGRPKGESTNTSSNQNKSILSSIEYAKASFRMPTPFFLRSSKGSGGRVSVSPSFDFVEGSARCVFSGDVGSLGRTKAVLRLDAEDSTLTIVRALDESKIIAPTISLNSGKIVYDYYLNLDGQQQHGSSSSHGKVNSSIRAHVDPTKGIILKWTDGIQGRGSGSGGSCWVTECRVPLGTTAAGPLAADVRVGRRWVI
mmetsp:Transcript_25451/g.54761  ORF Transcript_25451/g.54761 Transcript_25451/m.54761 type:complete len:586 (-) Transcript_25451:193-1950(-)